MCTCHLSDHGIFMKFITVEIGLMCCIFGPMQCLIAAGTNVAVLANDTRGCKMHDFPEYIWLWFPLSFRYSSLNAPYCYIKKRKTHPIASSPPQRVTPTTHRFDPVLPSLSMYYFSAQYYK